MGNRLESLTIPNVSTPRGTRKLTERPGSELWDVLCFHAYRRIRLNGHVGTIFTTDHITDAVRTLPERYSNVIILSGRSEYAPEMTCGYVFVSDRAYAATTTHKSRG